jgi:hypothetical protein
VFYQPTVQGHDSKGLITSPNTISQIITPAVCGEHRAQRANHDKGARFMAETCNGVAQTEDDAEIAEL